jgi:OmpA-OmpF porin, OOP family
MKKFLLITAVLGALGVNAQTDMNKWSLGASIGVHDGMSPTAGFTRIYQVQHYGVNGRYMFNNRFGVMLDMGYDLFDYHGSADRNPRYLRTSLQAVVNAGDIIKLHEVHPNLGLLIHAGGGLSQLWVAKEFRSESPVDPFIKNSDDMLNGVIGVRPQWRINDQISLNADMSIIGHIRQTWDFTMTQDARKAGYDGYFMNLSVGASFYLGTKGKKHADWTPTVYCCGPVGPVSSNNDAVIQELQEKIKDDDKDGVANYADIEPNTPAGSYVNSKGEALKDSDKDGIADEYDMCPDIKGTFSGDGCPDSDGDGIADNRDACPTIPGLIGNKGCPEITKEVKEVMRKALKDVQFETAKDVLLPVAYPALNEVVKVLMEHPEYKIQIDGHTDNVGDDNANLVLSQKRAQAAAVYLMSKGITSDRIIANGFGETRPKALNDTEDGRQQNRRVEFNIVF